MFNIINNTLKDKNYYICMYPNYIYVYNYQSIDILTDSLIYLSIENFKLKIKGNNLSLKKMEIKELLISGKLSEVSYEY